MALDVCHEDASAKSDLLANDWKTLEALAQPSVFLSWQWIGVWLSVYRPECSVIRVRDRGKLVGLGLVTESSERRHRVLVSRCLRLHQTGCPAEDQICIEYNGFLAEKDREAEVGKSAIEYLKQSGTGWDEIVIGAVEADYAQELAQASGLVSHIRWESPSYGVDLRSLRSGDQAYLDTLSRNTRHQIRRTRRLYEESGAVVLQRPGTVAEAEFIFHSITPLHFARWGGGQGESSFTNPEFIRFHQHYIRTHWEQGGADLIVLKAGDETLAIFYNLIYRNRVYFYLAGIRKEQDNRLKPGLLGHSLCIDDYLEKGFDFYDFMGGQDRYKAQLAEPHQHLVKIGLQRDRWKLRAERGARAIKHRLNKDR
ncbi:hypothetical protein GCM10011533_12500 [Streptosporangium jomthongense]|uniref:GNAT family N-acetyltransferase n=1 Tax=Marinobacter aromaticivorans TaxID=1494078 RepID=A0ABW2ITZ5_9GAMM|nr:GNAT family N-acetyltransferase [Marinobacter aromaticivorans]GGE61489.1 hypothetical protein GCM10011533_12500 [Streptosporangium jomthongense]